MATSAIASPSQHSLLLRHMPSLDSIRGIAVLMVIFFHGFATYAWVPNCGARWGALAAAAVGCGRFGVNVFFVLSGFLITGILVRTRERSDFYGNFYLRRVLRILPAYLLMLVVLKLSHTIDWRFALAATFFLANFSRIFGAPMDEYGSLWSLAVEEHFYLIWPTCVRLLAPKWLPRLLVLAIVGEPLLRLVAAHISSHIDIHYKTPFVLDFLAYGALLSLLVGSERIGVSNAPRIGWTITGVSAVLAVVEILVAAYHPGSSTLDALADLPFTWGTVGVIILGLSRDHHRLVHTGRTDSRGVLAFYGYISYGLYLLNVFLYAEAKTFVLHHFAASRLNSFPFFAGAVLACIAVSTAIAYVSRRYFEAPILQLKNKWHARFKPPAVPPPAVT